MEVGSMMKALLVLTLCCYSVLAQRPRPPNCPSAAQLLLSGCSIGCITLDSSVCASCDQDCSVTDECMPTDPSTCGADQICLAVGVAGRYTCMDRTPQGGECTISDSVVDDVVDRINELQSDLRERGIISQLGESVIPCAAGLVCRRESLEGGVCRPENTGGPCISARAGGADVDCDEDGDFEPLQCSPTDTGMFSCRCVEPSGETVPDSRMEVEDLDDAPDCDDIVEDRCEYELGGITFDVRSGEEFVDFESCRRCLCRDGSPVLCGPSMREEVCNALSRGRRPREDDDEREGNCRQCNDQPAMPVCGSDGQTYPSVCFAVNCVGLAADLVSPGPCSRRNVCEQFPCDEGEFCVRTGGVTCLSRRGCDPSRLRRCVDPAALVCANRDDDDDDDEEEEEGEEDSTGSSGSGEDETSESSESEETSESDSVDELDDDDVCGDDGITYPSVCRLLQNSGRVQVAFAGNCNRTECSGEEVCGTDGVTYDNICELRALSSARLEYVGECEEPDDEELAGDRCERIRNSGVCPDVSGCTTTIVAEDGCCPVCGGAVAIELDRDALDDYVDLNPSVATADDLVRRLIADRFIPEEVLEQCQIDGSLLETGDLHLLLENKDFSIESCFEAAQAIADVINNPPSGGDDARRSARAAPTDTYPEVLVTATGARTAPLLAADGAPRLIPSVLTALVLLLAAVMVL